MRISKEVLKHARENNASIEVLQWIIDNLDTQISRENIIPEHYIWLLSIGILPNTTILGKCVSIIPELCIKLIPSLLEKDMIDYIISLCPVTAIEHLSHRLDANQIEKCNNIIKEKSFNTKKKEIRYGLLCRV